MTILLDKGSCIHVYYYPILLTTLLCIHVYNWSIYMLCVYVGIVLYVLLFIGSLTFTESISASK